MRRAAWLPMRSEDRKKKRSAVPPRREEERAGLDVPPCCLRRKRRDCPACGDVPAEEERLRATGQ